MGEPAPKRNKGKPGRPKGSRNLDSILSREKMAAKLGLLPHEFLALVASGETIKVRRWDKKNNTWEQEEWNPTPEQQIDAAKAAAPYFQPRLVSQKIDHGPMMMKLDQDVLAKLPEPMLQALEMLVSALMTTNALPAIEAPRASDIDDAEYEELFQ
jgi:hypothetical protein